MCFVERHATMAIVPLSPVATANAFSPCIAALTWTFAGKSRSSLCFLLRACKTDAVVVAEETTATTAADARVTWDTDGVFSKSDWTKRKKRKESSGASEWVRFSRVSPKRHEKV